MYRLILCLTVAACALSGSPAHAWVYFGGYGSTTLGVLWRANQDGSYPEALLSGLSGVPTQLALDAAAAKIYWTGGGGINRANLDGTGRTIVVPEGPVTGNAMWGVAIDTVANKIYWSDRDLDKIQRANLDGSGIENVVTGVAQPRHLALDVVNSRIYWAQSGDRSPNVVQRARLDGTELELLASGSRPMGVALDPVNSKLYWTDVGTGTIERAAMNGAGRQVLTSGVVGGPDGPALDVGGGLMYWTEEAGTVRMATLDGTNSVGVVSLSGQSLKDVILVPGTTVPEPSSLALIGFAAIAALAWLRRRRKHRDCSGLAITYGRTGVHR